jgi:acetylornithine deacetylase
MKYSELYQGAIELLQALVRTPSFSREEGETARTVAAWLAGKGLSDIHRSGNNVWVKNYEFDPEKPTILLCSHHDTVKPNSGYTRDPFDGATSEERLWGLGSNDAGASVVSLAAAFRHFYERRDLKYNLVLAIVAEEEISGQGGIRSILPEMGALDFAIVGEPTGMQLAIAEKGLMVLDCTSHGRSGHAARNEGDNAIYRAVKDIEWFRTFAFPRVSDLFGEVKMSVTMISAGTQHNVVPAECRFAVDCRVTEKYTNEEVLEIVRRHVKCDVTPRSMHLRSSCIDTSHPIVQAGKDLGLNTFGSPTTSDQVTLDIPSVKIGPGQSARSHSADEYVELSEIEQGIETYIKLLDKILL